MARELEAEPNEGLKDLSSSSSSSFFLIPVFVFLSNFIPATSFEAKKTISLLRILNL